MTAYQDAVHIFEGAVAEFSTVEAGPLNSNGREASLFRKHYPKILETELKKYAYSFARKIVKLEKRGQTEDGRRYVYAVPADCIRIHSIRWGHGQGPFYRHWEPVSGEIVACHDETLYLRHAYIPPVADMSADFCQGIQLLVASKMVSAIRSDRVKSADLREQGKDALTEARILDKNQYGHEPVDAPEDSPLVVAWRGGNAS